MELLYNVTYNGDDSKNFHTLLISLVRTFFYPSIAAVSRYTQQSSLFVKLSFHLTGNILKHLSNKFVDTVDITGLIFREAVIKTPPPPVWLIVTVGCDVDQVSGVERRPHPEAHLQTNLSTGWMYALKVIIGTWNGSLIKKKDLPMVKISQFNRFLCEYFYWFYCFAYVKLLI